MLSVSWWAKQQEVARALVTHGRVLVPAAHVVGKTFLAAGLVNWWYDTFDPGLVLTTAPTDIQVRDLLWKEVRAQRRPRGGFRGPKMPRLESSERHWAHGFTAADVEGFQGRHEGKVLVVFDEAVGVDTKFWEAAETMASAWLCIYNPTDPSSQAFVEERTGNWKVIKISALEHPNIAAELAGQAPPYPSALRLDRLERLLKKWCSPIPQDYHAVTDIEWPPGSGKWLRPGPVAEARLLARWPTRAVNSVWSEVVWNEAITRILPTRTMVPEVGCDVARFGDDFTAIHVQQGGRSCRHETYNGWSTDQTAGRLKGLCRELASEFRCDPKAIPIKIDDDGVGGGVTDQSEDYNFIPVRAGSKAIAEFDYPNLRSELWFTTAELAAEGLISFAGLDPDTLDELRRQALAPTYRLDAKGRRTVEPKDETKQRIGRSPDDMDAVNLAYYRVQQEE